MAGETAEDVEVESEEDLGADDKGEDKKADEDEEVPVRGKVKTNADFARERIALKGKEDKGENEDKEELTPAAKKLIEAEIAKGLAPLQDEIAFRDYFSEHPEDKKYQKQARARFDAWGTVPIEEVMKTLRPETSKEDEDKAKDKVNRNSMKGSTARPKEETTATTQAELTKLYQDRKAGKIDSAEVLRKLGVK